MNLLSDNRRLVIAHNPFSSRSSMVKALVFDRLDAAGYTYTKIEVRQVPLMDNVARLAPLVQPGDIVLSAGGDGSAHAIFHTVMAASQPGVELGFLAFGNFNDVPNTFNNKKSLRDPIEFLEQARSETVHPISVFADGRLLRSALLYASIGWTATAANQFDDPVVRHKIINGGAGVAKSLLRTGRYYFKSRRGGLLPAFRVGEKSYTTATDALFVNGPKMARLFHTGVRYYHTDVFFFRLLDVRGVIKNVPFLLASLAGRMKGEALSKVRLEFEAPSTVTLQCDGEVVQCVVEQYLEVTKDIRPLSVLVTKRY